jgi:hypothetical protein
MHKTMLDLGENSLKSWFDRLPDDIHAAISEDIPSSPGGILDFCAELDEKSPSEYKDFLLSNKSLIESLGRIGRIRLLSFVCDKVYPYQSRYFHEIIHVEDESDEGGSSAIQIMLLEDIKAFNEAIAARAYKAKMDNVALQALQEAAYENPMPSAPFG